MKIKKNFFKNIFLLSTGAIILPAASCGQQEKVNLDYDENKKLVDDVNGKNFFDSLNQEEVIQLNLFKKYSQLSSEVVYDEEVEFSKTLQKGDFNFKLFEKNIKKEDVQKEIKELNNDIKKTSDKDKKDELKSQLNTKKKELENLEKDIKDINTRLEKLNKGTIDYNGDEFSVDYPLLLKPYKNVREEQEKIFKDKKEAFIRTFKTKGDGLKQWPTQRQRDYSGAASDDEAIDNATFNDIKSYANNRFVVKINNSYSVSKFIWANKTQSKEWNFLVDKDLSKRIWVKSDYKDKILAVLQDDTLDAKKALDNLESSVKSSNVYFLSTNSKNPIAILDDAKTFVESLTNDLGLINVQHGILAFKQGAKRDEPWKGSSSDFKKLLLFTEFKNGNAPEIESMGAAQFADPKIFDDDYEDNTKLILKSFGSPDSTVDKNGFLGLKTLFKYIKDNDPGFGLGVLAQITKEEKSESFVEFDPNEFAKRLLAELKVNLNEQGLPWNDSDDAKTKDDVISRLLTQKMKKEDVERKFGSVVREYFNSLGPIQMVYKVKGTNNYMVVSDVAGIHIIRVNKNINIYDEVKKDFQKMSDEQNTTSSTEITTLLNSVLNDERKIEYVYNDENLVKKLKDKLDKYNKTLENEYKKSNKTLEDKDKLSIEKVKKIVEHNLNSQKESEVVSSIKNNISSWYIKKLDGDLRDVTLTPQQLYQWALEAA